jgi:hypothetical protein
MGFTPTWKISYLINKTTSRQYLSLSLSQRIALQNVLLPFKFLNLNLLFRQIILVPIHFQYKKFKPVSYYAFFKGWLLPSLLTGCHSLFTIFALNYF